MSCYCMGSVLIISLGMLSGLRAFPWVSLLKQLL